MKDKHLLLSVGAILTTTIILLFSCKKINSATEIGGDLIPPVDNITTFDTTLEVEVYNDTFTISNDSARYFPQLFNSNYNQYLGMISNDPIFGKTDARLYFQLKPSFFKHTFANKPDSLYIDSVVLVLDYKDTYGDTTVPQEVRVYEIDQASDFRADSVYLVRENNIIKGNLLGSRTFMPSILNDSIQAYPDTIPGEANELRIPLDNSFGQRLLNYDTVASMGHEDAYSGDSVFNSKFKGFALESVSGNAIMGFDLLGTNTKLAIYYRYEKGGVGNFDTTVTYFNFNQLSYPSASANYIKRDYTGTPVAAAAGGPTPDDFAYIQTTPGTYAKIKIPGLADLNNSVVHRAELIMEEAYHPSDSMFYAPNYLFLDAFDPSDSKYRSIPYDFLLDITGANNLVDFGGLPYRTTDQFGNAIRSWRFNLSRYVQHVVNGTESAYDLRVYAPLYTTINYKPSVTSTGSSQSFSINPAIGKGRVRMYGGDATGTNPHRMRLRIVYSKI